MTLPQEILDRVNRVLDYHRSSKLDPNQPVSPSAGPPVKARIFTQFPKTPLATTLLDASVPTVQLLESGRDALPDSQLGPPQNLKTLSTWLFMADGMIPIRRNKKIVGYAPICPSSLGTAACELYVAALAIEGLEPGLYHFSTREFALRTMRDGHQALSLLKRGRPDLEFLKTTPGAILVSSVFSRHVRKFKARGYRRALHDAGQLLENISICGTALGIQTMTRMRLTESTSRELIGVPPDAPFDDAESVQAMIIWADPANKPMEPPAKGTRPTVEKPPQIARPAVAQPTPPCPAILSAHEDCVAPGVAIREIRPPLTESNPMMADAEMVEKNLPEAPPAGLGIFKTLTTHRAAADFHRRSIPRDAFLAINRVAFRGGSHFPLFPNGPHVGLIRPFWIVHSVSGIDAGIWYYHPPSDRWIMLERGEHRHDVSYLCREQPLAGNGSAVCFMFANLPPIMNAGGPDIYRLAHLEAGMAAMRIYLAANALDLGCAPIGDFYDEDVRKFLGLEHTGWQPIHAAVVGVSIDDRTTAAPAVAELNEDNAWDK